MTCNNAVLYALDYYELEYGKAVGNASARADYRGRDDGGAPSYLVMLADLDGKLIANIRIDADTGELIGFE